MIKLILGVSSFLIRFLRLKSRKGSFTCGIQSNSKKVGQIFFEGVRHILGAPEIIPLDQPFSVYSNHHLTLSGCLLWQARGQTPLDLGQAPTAIWSPFERQKRHLLFTQ